MQGEKGGELFIGLRGQPTNRSHFTDRLREDCSPLSKKGMVQPRLSPKTKLPKFSFKSPNRQQPTQVQSRIKAIIQHQAAQPALPSPNRETLFAKDQGVGELRRVVSERKFKAESRYRHLCERLAELKSEYASQEHTLAIINSAIADHF